MATNEIKDFFDRLAPDWTNSTSEYDVREKITAMMNLPANSVIADVGCGKGVMFEHLLKTKPLKIIGIDVSGEMLKYAKELHTDPRISYINGDVLTAPLPELDAVVIFNSYPHLMDKKALVGKLSKHLRTGGMVIIAHSVGKVQINGRHQGGMASAISIPLREAEVEAADFAPLFIPQVLVDNDEMYFIKMLRAK